MPSPDRAARKAADLRARLAATTDPDKRFKLAVKLAKYEARAQAARPAAAPAAPRAPTLRVTPASAATIAPPPLTAAELARRAARAARFDGNGDGPSSSRPAAPTLRAAARAAGRDRAFGASTELEKEYLRLTSLPTVDAVRPPQVLAAALAHVKSKWRSGAPYSWACPQLKSIRQDITVQGVRDALAVDAYETHARVALEADDLAEFNQCATALVELHAKHRGRAAARNAAEFAGYRLLYAAATGAGLAVALRGVSEGDRQSSAVRHALRCVSAARAGDAAALAAAFDDAPRMAPYLMDRLVPATHKVAAQRIVRAFRPAVPLAAAARWLGLASDHAAAAALLIDAGARVEGDAVITRAEGGATAAAPPRGKRPAERGDKPEGGGGGTAAAPPRGKRPAERDKPNKHKKRHRH